MSTKDFLTLSYVRNEWRFFAYRVIVWLIITLVFFYPDSFDFLNIINKNQKELILMFSLLFCISILMFFIYKIKFQNQYVKITQKELIKFCQTVTSMVRSGLLVVIAIGIYSIFVSGNHFLNLVYIYFLLQLLELTTRIHIGMDDFEYGDTSNDDGNFPNEGTTFIVEVENSEEELYKTAPQKQDYRKL